jgi:hypothetical protein
MAGSAAEALGHAIDRTKQLLFPLKPEKWFALGFTVFLAQCGESNYNSVQLPNIPFGGSSSPPVPRHGPVGTPATELQRGFEELVRALNADTALYVTIAVVSLVTLVGLSLFIAWFSSRAKLMFVESVVFDRVSLGQQWASSAELGLSLFKCRLLFTLAGFLVATLAIGCAVVTGFSDFKSGNVFGPQALLGFLLMGLAFFLLGFPLAIASLLLDDFVTPLMVIRNVRVSEAWSICRREVLSGNLGGLFVFYVLRVLLAFGIAIAVLVIRCVTCCVAALPYLSSVILLPILVFWRAFPLYYLEQIGVQVFPAPEPAKVAYDQWRFPT